MIWVDQPIGTGYTTGTPKATSQEETAQDFIAFFKNFEDIFGIKNYKIYVTGESCRCNPGRRQIYESLLMFHLDAGRYVPYVPRSYFTCPN